MIRDLYTFKILGLLEKKRFLLCILLCAELGIKPPCELQQVTLGFNQTLIALVGICVRDTHRSTFYSDLSALERTFLPVGVGCK